MLANPQTYFANLPDPRRQTRNKLHKLEDIVMITLCAILSGFEDWVSIEDFGHENEQWLRSFLELRNGILRIPRDAGHDSMLMPDSVPPSSRTPFHADGGQHSIVMSDT